MEHNTSIAIQNLTDYNNGITNFTWLELPASEEDIQKALEKINALEEEDFFISDFETDLELPKSEFDITTIMELEELSNTLEDFETLNEWEQEETAAILEFETMSLETAMDNQRKGRFIFHSGITDAYDLGEYYFEEIDFCGEQIPSHLRNYIDYKAYGEDIAMYGMFTTYGFITE